MTEKIQAVRGMHDLLPEQSARWQRAEAILRRVLAAYFYQEIRLPLVEKTELFKRSIGEVTDIVEKEMYTFDDRNGDSLTLRPEGTAGCLRACMEHGLLHNQIQRLWYAGPMFRHERPQKGRYRQFYQLGVEAYGMPGPDIDAELILLTQRLWREFGIAETLTLQLNSLGTTEERLVYRGMLIDYFCAYREKLDEDGQRRLHSNPLRILDSKNPEMRDVILGAPTLMEYLGEESRSHFALLCEILTNLGVDFVVNPRLVRGLDYYSRTVFEWVTQVLGSQGTVCAGGRYDGLIEQLGGRSSHAIGFAMGMERLLALLEQQSEWQQTQLSPDLYMIAVGPAAEKMNLMLAERLRDVFPDLRIQLNCGGGGFKSQFKKADKSGARFAIILGEDEVNNGMVAIKPLRGQAVEQLTISQAELMKSLTALL